MSTLKGYLKYLK